MILDRSHYTKDELEIIDKEMYGSTLPKRREPGEYAFVSLASCSSDGWWYKDLVGLNFFCKLTFSEYRGKKVLKDAMPVQLVKNTVIIGRAFHAKDVIIL